MDKSTASGFEAEYVAEKVLDMVINEDKDLIISQFVPNLAIFLRRFAPSVYHWAMTKRAVKTA